MANASNKQIDRYTDIGTLSVKVRAVVKRTNLPLAIILACETLYLVVSNRPGGAALGLIGAGTWISLYVWSQGGIGLPLMPMMAIQTLVIYGVPIMTSHDVILEYPQSFVFSAGVEVLIFGAAMTAAWNFGMRTFHPSPPICYALHKFSGSGVKGWSRLGFGMIGCATGFIVLQDLNLLDSFFLVLPGGAYPIVLALLSAMSACGFFLVSLVIGGNEATTFDKVLFWSLLVGNAMISALDFILASAAANLITVAIGLFWSRGRVPWRYLAIAMLSLSFFNTGKATMRARYWGNDDSPATSFTLEQLPACYSEWAQASYDAILENNAEKSPGSGANESQSNKNQTLLDRVDNLQNLLFVIDAIKTNHITPLYGDTYLLIPPLLVPRVLWPNKPRGHEGQVLLNVHFGRQDLDSTYATYIAWGLLPEAYGNFGPIAGSVVLGCALGFLFAWIENVSAKKLIISMEGFLLISFLMNLMNSFEMVASILVTSTFQSMVVIVLASAPFVRRTVVKPRMEEEY
jgi:hypothetical protein